MQSSGIMYLSGQKILLADIKSALDSHFTCIFLLYSGLVGKKKSKGKVAKTQIFKINAENKPGF